MDEEMNISELAMQEAKNGQTKTILLLIEKEKQEQDEKGREVLQKLQEKVESLLV